jgi:hypothetical protein
MPYGTLLLGFRDIVYGGSQEKKHTLLSLPVVHTVTTTVSTVVSSTPATVAAIAIAALQLPALSLLSLCVCEGENFARTEKLSRYFLYEFVKQSGSFGKIRICVPKCDERMRDQEFVPINREFLMSVLWSFR